MKTIYFSRCDTKLLRSIMAPRPFAFAGSVIQIACVVLSYWTISISMVFANKYLVGDKKSTKELSMFIAWAQCVITVLLIIGGKLLSASFGYVRRGTWHLDLEIPKCTSGNFECYKRLLMMTACYVSMLTVNNLCLKNVGVAFYQVARSLTIIFTVVLSVIVLKRSVSWRVTLCCVAVAAGFVLGVDQEKVLGDFSLSGVVYGVISSFFVAMMGILTKRALDVVDRDSVKLTLYNNVFASLLFIPFIVVTSELQTVINSKEILYDTYFWGCLLATGFLGFSIAWISALQIDLTSPLTHTVSANTKAVLQTILAVMVYHEIKTVYWWFSVCLVIGGAFVYAVVRMKEEQWEKEKLAALEESTDEEKGLINNNMKT